MIGIDIKAQHTAQILLRQLMFINFQTMLKSFFVFGRLIKIEFVYVMSSIGYQQPIRWRWTVQGVLHCKAVYLMLIEERCAIHLCTLILFVLFDFTLIILYQVKRPLWQPDQRGKVEGRREI